MNTLGRWATAASILLLALLPSTASSQDWTKIVPRQTSDAELTAWFGFPSRTCASPLGMISFYRESVDARELRVLFDERRTVLIVQIFPNGALRDTDLKRLFGSSTVVYPPTREEPQRRVHYALGEAVVTFDEAGSAAHIMRGRITDGTPPSGGISGIISDILADVVLAPAVRSLTCLFPSAP